MSGFGTSKYHADLIAQRLATYFDRDFEALTLVDAQANPEKTAKLIHLGRVVTHSAGILPTQNAIKQYYVEPEEIVSVAGPVPTSRFELIRRAEHLLNHSVQDIAHHPSGALSIALHGLFMAGEVAKNRRFHTGILPEISRFNVIQEGIDNIVDRNISTKLIMMENDEFFRPNEQEYARAMLHGLPIVSIDGEHPDLVFNPTDVLERAKIREILPESPVVAVLSESDSQFQVPIAHQTLAG